MGAKQFVLGKPLCYEVNLLPQTELWGPFLVPSYLHKIIVFCSLSNCKLIYLILPLINKSVRSSLKGALVLPVIYFVYYKCLWNYIPGHWLSWTTIPSQHYIFFLCSITWICGVLFFSIKAGSYCTKCRQTLVWGKRVSASITKRDSLDDI